MGVATESSSVIASRHIVVVNFQIFIKRIMQALSVYARGFTDPTSNAKYRKWSLTQVEQRIDALAEMQMVPNNMSNWICHHSQPISIDGGNYFSYPCEIKIKML